MEIGILNYANQTYLPIYHNCVCQYNGSFTKYQIVHFSKLSAQTGQYKAPELHIYIFNGTYACFVMFGVFFVFVCMCVCAVGFNFYFISFMHAKKGMCFQSSVNL